MSLLIWIKSLFINIKTWIVEHDREILWAGVFGLFFAGPSAILYEYWQKVEPYKIYVVGNRSDDADTATVFGSLQKAAQMHQLKIGRVPVELQILDEAGTESDAVKDANSLAHKSDTLMVIGHVKSQLTEAVLPIYFGQNPPIPIIATTETDDDLLIKCNEPKSSCYDQDNFVPLLQLSPTNSDQGKAAVDFAVQHNKKRFLIIFENDQDNKVYSDSLVQAYTRAVGFHQGTLVVGTYPMTSPPKAEDLNFWNPDCILYAGRLGGASTLVKSLSGRDVMLILSDTAVQPTLLESDADQIFPKKENSKRIVNVRFTYQTDASDYSSSTNVYGQDAFAIVTQLINDVNDRPKDFLFRVRALAYLDNIVDARRSLVAVMKQNSMYRTFYVGTSNTTYLFQKHKRFNGLFHVWQLVKTPGTERQSEMVDVDGWHAPKFPNTHQPTSAPVVAVKTHY